jgi:predicted O-methyltransferase YrrM
MIDFPWLVKEAVFDILEFIKIRSSCRVLEFGSGRSTIFFSKFVEKLISVDHDSVYYNQVTKLIYLKSIKNVTLNILPRPYNKICDTFEDQFFDLILVDGRDRVLCIKSCEKKLKKDGILILDNSDRKRYKEGVEYLLSLGYIEKKYMGNDGYEKTKWMTSIYKYH